jgi:hypothetical protein
MSFWSLGEVEIKPKMLSEVILVEISTDWQGLEWFGEEIK